MATSNASRPKLAVWWIGSIAAVLVGACVAIAAGFSSGGVKLSNAAAQAPAQPAAPLTSADASYEGVISDTHCGAKHIAAINQSAGDCTRRCVHTGEQFVLIDRDTLYVLDGDLPLLKKLAGERVRVVGTLDGKTLRVASVVGL
jgi:hypothetical protein